VPKSSIPYVAHVSNREAAIGGRDAQSLEDARLRAPQALRTRSRAVTADDFEYLACEVPGVARARCLAPGDQASGPGDVRPGQVAVVVLSGNADEGYIPPEQLGLSDDLRAAVTSHLSERCLVGIRLSVIPPQLFQVTVEAVVTVPERSDQEFARWLQRQAEDALYRYLNPYTGGPEQQGWPFGRALHISGIYGVLQRVSGVDFVQSVRLSVVEPSNPGVVRPVDTRLVLPPAGIICSGRHQVLVQ
jgi:predicted phage baseplate assembly protein